MKTASKLGAHIRKAMLWEIWDRVGRRIIWFCRDATGLVFRVDPDSLQLQGFYPIPTPMLAVTTTDSRIPRPFFDLYAKLAADLDEVSARISNLTKQVKVRGAYNAASRDIADILMADDQKMIPVEGVDMITGGLAAHIWIVPILDFMNALDKLFLAREQTKQAIYEMMGISDIMRGATKAVGDGDRAAHQGLDGSLKAGGRQAAGRQLRQRSAAPQGRDHRQEFRRRDAQRDDRRGGHARRSWTSCARTSAAPAPSTSRPTARCCWTSRPSSSRWR